MLTTTIFTVLWVVFNLLTIACAAVTGYAICDDPNDQGTSIMAAVTAVMLACTLACGAGVMLS